MSDLIPNQNGKLTNFKNDLKFRNDFGEAPLGLGHFTSDQGFIAVASVVGAFVGAAIAGLPLAALVAIAGVNDIVYARKPSVLEPEAEPEVRTLATSAHPLFIGTRTRLEAIEAPVESAEMTDTSLVTRPSTPLSPLTPAFAPPQTVEGIAAKASANTRYTPVDIALEMAKVPKSTIIAASPRVGKGVVVSMALAHLRQLHPDLEIWLIDPKDEPTELHYWAGIDPDKRCHFDLRDFDVDIEAAIEASRELLTRFNRSPKHRKLLIIDEFVTLNQKCAGTFMNQLKDFIVGICSSGEVNPDMGIGRFVWVITQSPYVSDIGFKTKAALATFQRVFLLNKASSHLYSLAVSASFVPAGFEQKLSRLLEPTGRIFYYSRTDSWHPIPKYELPNSQSDSLLRAKLEGLLAEPNPPSGEPTVQDSEPPKRDSEPLSQAVDEGSFELRDGSQFSSEPKDERFTPLNLTREQAIALIEQLRTAFLNQTQIIETIWRCKKGGSAAWKEAYAQFKGLMGE